MVIAKLDRLSRNLAFVATLMESGVEFVAVDNLHANKLTIHILAAVAEHELAEVNRMAGKIVLKSPEPDIAKAQEYFNRALAVARPQQAKSWELRAAMSMARLWRDQGKTQQARELLAPVYGWFSEGFDTLDLKQAKALLDELQS